MAPIENSRDYDDSFCDAPKEIMQLRGEAYKAALEGRAADLARYLESGHLLCTPLYNGLIQCAFEAQSIPTLEVLLEYGWDINTPERSDYPPFLGKIFRDSYHSGSVNMELLHWFLDHGADPNAYAGMCARTPLSDAVAFSSSLDIIKLLFDHGGSAAEGDLIYYVTKYWDHDPDGLLEKMRFLIDKGASVNEALFERYPHMNDFTIFSYTPLIHACLAENVEMVKLLLAAGADPRKRSWFGESPLQTAEKKGNKEIQKIISDAIAGFPRL